MGQVTKFVVVVWAGSLASCQDTRDFVRNESGAPMVLWVNLEGSKPLGIVLGVNQSRGLSGDEHFSDGVAIQGRGCWRYYRLKRDAFVEEWAKARQLTAEQTSAFLPFPSFLIKARVGPDYRITVLPVSFAVQGADGEYLTAKELKLEIKPSEVRCDAGTGQAPARSRSE